MDYRISLAHRKRPKDPFTYLAVFIIKFTTTVIGLLLLPVQFITTFATGLLISLTFGLALIPFTLIWMPFIILLMTTSWLWIHAWYLRPILLLPGVAIAVLASTYSPLIAEMGETGSRYSKLSVSQEWPMSWYLIRPSAEYYSNHINPNLEKED